MPIGEPDIDGIIHDGPAARSGPPGTPPPPSAAQAHQFRGFDTPDGRPPLSKRRLKILFFIGLCGGTAFSLFILSFAPNALKNLLEMIFFLMGLKLALGLMLVIKWRTRTLGTGLILSIPLTILFLIAYTTVMALISTATVSH